MTYINYNYAANLAANAIGRNDRALDSAMNRISTGSRVGNGNSELGMFGVILADKDRVVLNKHAGFLLRTKLEGTDEGGVAAGYAVLSSPLAAR